MATCAENKVIADAFIVSLYPEIVGLAAFMDSIAALGRLVFVVTLDDTDHGEAVKKECEDQLTGLGYTVTKSSSDVTIVCPC
jgi:hypothetical protein